MTLLSLLEGSPTLLIGLAMLAGLLVGSFLNVVIYRLPVMMERAWKQEARMMLELPEEPDTSTFNLALPASSCPHCGHKIRWYENVPLISWLVLRGKCSACSAPISTRYPIIECVAAIMAGITAWQVGYSDWLPALIIAGWCLLALAMIDFDTTLLPDSMTYPLLWAGLLLAVMGISPVSLTDAVIGAAAGYLTLWSVYWAFKLLTGKEGMGYGDFKLLAALGAWLGWQMLPLVIVLSSLVGAVVGGLLMLSGLIKRDQGIPFGPYLAGAGWLALLWGQDIVTLYLGLFKY
ncbi:MAG: prepilin peptidase [Gammaproteobacteria bacterium HGW-Gammaproteobacteria-14]|nr:MAG: prepilin peptidase [Gammaproteobacteria bacterium HGW-Gammaproteobacteria-14]